MTLEQAKAVAQEYLDHLSGAPGHYAILQTFEKHYGWVIYWNTSKYAHSFDRRDGEIGTGPLVVEKGTSLVHPLSSGVDQDGIVRRFEKDHGFDSNDRG
jgi:hypothetical protein